MKIAKRQALPKIFLLTVVIAVFTASGCARQSVPDTSIQDEQTVEKVDVTQSVGEHEVDDETESSATVERESMVEYLPGPTTLEERFSYTYGYLLMVTAMRDVQGIDPVYFARGALDSGLANEPLIPTVAMNSVLYEYQDKLITEAARRLEELASKNLEDAESFLAVNGKREGVVTTPSGLQYEIVKSSEGERPSGEDTVKVNYRLTYLDGREGDASIRGIPSSFDLTSLVPGFREGLMLMTVGSEFRFFVHPSLGYGEEGSTRIEPNTLLIFDVELVEIVD